MYSSPVCGVAGGGADSGWARRVSWRRRRRQRPHSTRYGAAGRTARTHVVCPHGASSPAPQARVRPIHAPHMHVTDGLWLYMYMSAWLLTGAKGEAHQHVELREVLPNEGEGAVVVSQVLVAARLTWLGLGLGVGAGLGVRLGPGSGSGSRQTEGGVPRSRDDGLCARQDDTVSLNIRERRDNAAACMWGANCTVRLIACRRTS